VIILVWHTFQYSVGLPVLFIIAVVNLTTMYWFDKYLVLRIYNTPANLDEKPIKHALQMFYWVFVMHFVVGYSMITNDSIISSDELVDSSSFSLDDATGINFFDQKRYQTYHAQVFFSLSLILILTAKVIVESKIFCGDTIENFFIKIFATNGTVEDESSISDDYYDLMSAKFLINEYERTKVYLQDL
jgi:hypothetical protein